MRKCLLIVFLLPLLTYGQILGRYDVSGVAEIDATTWELSGTVSDMTGSYTAQDAVKNDRIVMRGIDTTGKMIFDRFRVDSILTATTTELIVYVKSDTDDGILNNAGMPLSGSFPICRVLPNTKTMVKPSWYQEQFDPDYDAAIDNLNSEENQTYPPFHYEILSDNQTNITIPFKLKQSSKVFYNGVVIREGQWSGVGTHILTVNFSTKVYDFLFIAN